MNPQIEELNTRIIELERTIKALQASATIPIEFDNAFRDRFLTAIPVTELSAKSATSENKTVNEGGAASYSVMNKPDGFLEVAIGGTIYYIPYFT